ncbi:3'(2'),5'-bisphosphate nucleotidase [Tremella mesenterica]|uniref:3'(2'),5'-bisphosphate nucleotidase n=1 Tax=Tremella mesenterica TaxID=5217 RepID=A0A4Q1BHJ8_TREME|nr:3'(2'),5'-bisphosphate nucleotidase [Tremella mesenterica]
MSVPPFTRLHKEADLGVLSVLRASADLSAQALISLHLRSHFPSDLIIGEEDTSELRSNSSLLDRVIGLVNDNFQVEEGWGKNQQWSQEEILAAIDAGSASGGSKGRYWTIDPVDGTSGFIRHQQYAVCLALIIDGEVELGIIGCPNLGAEPAKLGEEVIPNGQGVLMIAIKGEGSWSRPLSTPSYTRISLPSSPSEPSPLTFLESVEAGHSAHDIQANIGRLLGVQRPSLRMDSQAKYACLARGEGGIYLRIPTKYSGGKDYIERIWDHASGCLLIHESGGVCTDMHGKPLKFGVGRTLAENEGIVAAGRDTHPKVIAAVKQAIEAARR